MQLEQICPELRERTRKKAPLTTPLTRYSVFALTGQQFIQAFHSVQSSVIFYVFGLKIQNIKLRI
jgi:hypothetical protein